MNKKGFESTEIVDLVFSMLFIVAAVFFTGYYVGQIEVQNEAFLTDVISDANDREDLLVLLKSPVTYTKEEVVISHEDGVLTRFNEGETVVFNDDTILTTQKKDEEYIASSFKIAPIWQRVSESFYADVTRYDLVCDFYYETMHSYNQVIYSETGEACTEELDEATGHIMIKDDAICDPNCEEVEDLGKELRERYTNYHNVRINMTTDSKRELEFNQSTTISFDTKNVNFTEVSGNFIVYDARMVPKEATPVTEVIEVKDTKPLYQVLSERFNGVDNSIDIETYVKSYLSDMKGSYEFIAGDYRVRTVDPYSFESDRYTSLQLVGEVDLQLIDPSKNLTVELYKLK